MPTGVLVSLTLRTQTLQSLVSMDNMTIPRMLDIMASLGHPPQMAASLGINLPVALHNLGLENLKGLKSDKLNRVLPDIIYRTNTTTPYEDHHVARQVNLKSSQVHKPQQNPFALPTEKACCKPWFFLTSEMRPKEGRVRCVASVASC